MLKLERPLVFADFETTGVDIANDRIIQMSFAKFNVLGDIETKKYTVNPGIPIPIKSTEVHGITDADVKDLPPFSRYATGILDYILGCDLAGFNSNKFDYPLLNAELVRCGKEWNPLDHKFIDVGNIFKIKEERTLSAAYKLYCGKTLEGAHDAENDNLATAEILEAQLSMYEDIPKSIPELAAFSNFGKKMLDLSGLFVYADDGIQVVFGLGKNKGKPANDYDYLKWVYYTSNFPKDTKVLAKQFMDAIPFK